MVKIITIISIVFLLFVIHGVLLSIHDVWQNSGQTTSLTSQLIQKNQQNQFLTQKLSYVQSNGYIEQEARNNLGLIRAGEHVILVPSPIPQQTIKAQTSIEQSEGHWLQWLKLIQ